MQLRGAEAWAMNDISMARSRRVVVRRVAHDAKARMRCRDVMARAHTAYRAFRACSAVARGGAFG